ncbi:MAG: hypothetical protein WA728_05540 [Xanthobacteraceae bacterium]
MNRLIGSIATVSVLALVAGVTLTIPAALATAMMNGPAVGRASGPSISAPAVERLVSVNRVNKGDRLSQAPTGRLPQSPPSTEAVNPPKRVPLGCEPAFSPVADPGHANIYKRCMV